MTKEELLKSQTLKSSKVKSSPYKVLVVDDKESIRNLIVTLLTQKGHSCETTANGHEALDKITKTEFNASITDIVMPEMDGITLTKEIPNRYQRLPVMIITGYTEEYSAETAMTGGAREFITKPFSPTEFIIRFDKMMRE